MNKYANYYENLFIIGLVIVVATVVVLLISQMLPQDFWGKLFSIFSLDRP